MWQRSVARSCCKCRLLSSCPKRTPSTSTCDSNQNEQKHFTEDCKSGGALKDLHQWKSKDEFLTCLINSVFFNHDGIIALSKPYGVGLYRQTGNPRSALSRSQVSETKYIIEDALPALKEHFKLKYLQILKSTERFTSGICLLAASEKAAAHVKKCARKSSVNHVPYQTYWSITRRCPKPEEFNGTVGYKLVKVEDKELEPEVLWVPSRRQSKLGNLKLVMVQHRILSSNRDLDVALCEVGTNTNKSHFVRVYLVQRACCVLGDTLYSPRLRTVLGRTIILSPHNYDKHIDEIPHLDSKVLVKLGLKCRKGQEMANLPVMLHLRSLTLTGWHKDKNLVLTAPLPEHFSWTCEQLELDTTCKKISLPESVQT